MAPRFLTLADVAETLALSAHQTYQLVRTGQLRAIKIGSQWRVEVSELEDFVERMYAEAASCLPEERTQPDAPSSLLPPGPLSR
jgi:excisionase family DNA binding protein